MANRTILTDSQRKSNIRVHDCIFDVIPANDNYFIVASNC